jgi:AraC-like DNA-binding protein
VHFRHFNPHPLLKGYVEKLWVFESAGRVTDTDLKLIVPNDRLKIAIPYKNEIVVDVGGVVHLTKEHTFTLTGIMDMPFQMDIASDDASGTICAEFSPLGAYCFFPIALSEVRNKVISVSEILNGRAYYWEERISNAVAIEDKVILFQQFLCAQVPGGAEDKVFEFCVDRIRNSVGKITVRDLEKQTGYSSRWLNMKFADRLGISPKNLASLIRFKHYYEALCNPGKTKLTNPKPYYQHYYDQAHFIKDFKRFTGLTPAHLEKKVNDWGRIFYNA